MPEPEHDLMMIGFSRTGERYFFFFTAEKIDQTIETFRRFAANPDLNFTSEDAEFLSEKVREEKKIKPT
ncbi:MAG: hypothetical protein HYT36_02120 [Candidatus Staskawiczbacteria bacterium]|nr:hypothetical protein [Candidatus Staskawiczbacteria bacterium]